MNKDFIDHGIAMPVSDSWHIVATLNRHGNPAVLAWISDHRGGYAILMIDVATGKSREFPTPFNLPPTNGSPFVAHFSRAGKYYSHFGSHFVEFDPISEAFTLVRETHPFNGQGMAEDDSGTVYAITYPRCGVVSYNHETGIFCDFGSVHHETWDQYARYVATDDLGWLYFAVGNTLSQIVAFDPRTQKAIPLLHDTERIAGITSYVHRGVDGKVYGLNDCHAWGGNGWYELYGGNAKHIGRMPPIDAVKTNNRLFPDGSELKTMDMWTRSLVIINKDSGAEKIISFTCDTEGAHVMSVAAAPDNSIWGAAAFPMSAFHYHVDTDTWVRHRVLGQWNCVLTVEDRCYIGAYTHGYLQEWNPSEPWVDTERHNPECNPKVLVECHPDIDRPHCLLHHKSSDIIVMGGIPGYGYTGGGLLFYDRESKEHSMLTHESILRWHSTMSLAEISDNRLLGGTTTRPGTGGEKRAVEAELYIIHMDDKKVNWHAAVIPGAQEYSQLYPGPRGLVYGLASMLPFDHQRMAEAKLFFVFDPERRTMLHLSDTVDDFGPICYQQGQRKMVSSPDGRVYILFRRCVAEIDPTTFALRKVAEVTEDIFSGGAMVGDRIVYSNGSHVCSASLFGHS